MWLDTRHHFNGSSLLCFGLASLVLWQRHWVIFHITAHPLPDTSKMDKINIHTATKNRAPQNQCHLFDQRLLPQARADCAQMSFQCDLAGLHPDSCMWSKCPLGHPWPFLCLPIQLLSEAPQGTAGWVTGENQSGSDKETRIKFPDSYLNNLLWYCHHVTRVRRLLNGFSECEMWVNALWYKIFPCLSGAKRGLPMWNAAIWCRHLAGSTWEDDRTGGKDAKTRQS